MEINLGLVQTKRVHVPTAKGTNPVWNKDVMFVAAEPFEELLQVTVKDRVGNKVSRIFNDLAPPSLFVALGCCITVDHAVHLIDREICDYGALLCE